MEKIIIMTGILSIIKNRKNIIIVLISMEIILLGLITLFLQISIQIDDIFGVINSLFLLTIGATESAICLTLLLLYLK